MSLIAITDRAALSDLKTLIADLVDEPANLQLSWLDAKDWIVAPLESASHFNEELAERLSEAFQLVECSQIFAIATEPLGEFPEGFLVDTSKEGLLSFHNKCCHFQFALMPGDRSQIVVCTAYDYLLIAGTEEIVACSVGGNVDAAWREFRKAATDPWWEKAFPKVVRRYEPFERPRKYMS